SEHELDGLTDRSRFGDADRGLRVEGADAGAQDRLPEHLLLAVAAAGVVLVGLVELAEVHVPLGGEPPRYEATAGRGSRSTIFVGPGCTIPSFRCSVPCGRSPSCSPSCRGRGPFPATRPSGTRPWTTTRRARIACGTRSGSRRPRSSGGRPSCTRSSGSPITGGARP